MTLIEVIVALLIFSFGLLGLIGLQGRAHSFAMSAEDRSSAALLANEIVSTTTLAAIASNNGTVDGKATLSMPTAAAISTWNGKAALVLPNGLVAFGALSADSKRLPVTIQWTPPTAASAASNAYVTAVVLP